MKVSLGELVRFKLMVTGGYLSIEVISDNEEELLFYSYLL